MTDQGPHGAPSPEGEVSPRLARLASQYVGWLQRHHRTLLWLALLLCLPTAYASARLFMNLRASFEELLPDNARSVQGLRAIREKVGSTQQLKVVLRVKSGDGRQAMVRFADLLAARLKSELPQHVGAVDYHIKVERAFFKKRGWVYLDVKDLKQLRGELRKRVAYEKRKRNPLYIDLEGDKPPEVNFKKLIKKHTPSSLDIGNFKDGYFVNQDGTVLAMIIRRPRGAPSDSHRMIADVKKLIAEIDPHKYHPQMEYGLSGDVALTVQETASLMQDIIISTVVVFLLCGLVVLIYYRRLRSLYLLGFPLLVGMLVTFGVSYVAIGYLNSNTAFLASIVLGNGINFGIMLLARYTELRDEAGSGPLTPDQAREVVSRSVTDTAMGTFTASAAASIAYGSLVLTDFRGFNQFGIIGGIGMIFCWLASFSVLPALLLADEARLARRKGGAPLARPASRRGLFGLLADVVLRAPGPILAAGVLLVAGSVVVSVPYFKDPIEWDFSKLRSARTEKSGAGYWDKVASQVFTRYLTPTVILAKDREDAKRMATMLREEIARQKGRSVIENVDVAGNIVPPVEKQRERIAVALELREILVKEIRQYLNDKQKQELDEVTPPADLRPVTVEDLPESIRHRVSLPSGELTSAVMVFPKTTANMWDARDALKFEEPIRRAENRKGEQWLVGSTAILFNDMIRAIQRDGPRSTLISFLGVCVLCVLTLASLRRGLVLVLTLCGGVITMAGMLAAFGVRINFLNFIAFPITFGIGVDYAVNIYRRYLVEGPGRVSEVVRGAGGAVALCSVTTIIGYSALLIADNRGLVSFGLASDLGELTCLIFAVLVLPAALVLLERRRR